MAHQNVNAVFYATSYHPIQAGSIDGTDVVPHDNAVYRALIASSTGLYDPTGDQKAEGDPYTTLFVGRIARHTTEKTLHQAMSTFGTVKRLRLVRDIVTGDSRGYAFVQFETDEDLEYAYENAQHYVIDGSQILVDYNRQKLMAGWIPRRLGGGLGGHKESGQLRFGGRDRPFRAPLREIPQEQLTKLGIPLPPVGRFMSRFQLPPMPRRPEKVRDSSHHGHKHSHKRKHSQKLSDEDEQPSSSRHQTESSKSGRQTGDAERVSSRRRREEEIARKNSSEEDRRHHRRRSRNERDERSSRSNREDRGGSRHSDRSGSRSSHKHRERGSTHDYDRSPKRGRRRDD